MSTRFIAVILITGLFACSPENEDESTYQRKFVTSNPDPKPLSPKESIKKIQLPPGYRVELVASEPMVQEPVAIAWDGNGRMYVVQMNTYMKDANATEEYEPTSRIMRLEDTNGDGVMDKFSVFADSLVLPRTVLPVGDEVLVTVTNAQHVWSYKDTNGDGVADEKKIVFNNPAIDSRNLEHQNGAFYWNLDNWIYPSRDNLRYKYKNGMLVADTLVDNMIGQWGLTSDNYGKLFYSEAGPGLPAVQIQQMPAYGSLNFRDQYAEDFTILWPVIGNVDAQGGPRALREDSSLVRFTSGAGQSIFRGDRLPADMQGDYFIPEPVGRVIKRGKVINHNGKIFIESAYREKDWLASADMNFRPINTYTGPDGCFYIVDMYHGIIQEGEWTPPESYLGKKIIELGLDKNRSMGRIYRVVHKSFKPDNTKPNMLNESTAQLTTYLSHPNGWWRDMAQQTIIVRNDKSVVPQLKQIATQHPSHMARIHALWTLEGLEALNKEILFAALTDTNAHVRKSAVWASELFIRQKDADVISRLSELTADSSADVRIQLMLSLRSSSDSKAQAIVKELLTANPENELMQFSYKMFEETKMRTEAELARLKNLSPADRALVSKGAVRYKQLCSNCHGVDGKGVLMGNDPMPAPPLVGSPRVTGDKIALIQLMLMGLQGPVDGKEYPNTMPPMAGSSDEYLASVLSYIRNSSDFGNKASVITEEEVKEVRGFTKHLPPGGTTLRSLEIGKLGRAERQNWDKKK
ncbi:MAG: HEAT repeat domain-containing protein [Cyclobacteriaceae bacterium]|nr:HEAT repeat domain-containing protein [Cyclobacteriaceae bacterium]